MRHAVLLGFLWFVMGWNGLCAIGSLAQALDEPERRRAHLCVLAVHALVFVVALALVTSDA